MMVIFGFNCLPFQSVLPQRALEAGYQFRFGNIKDACEEFAHLDYEDPDQ